MSRRHSRTAVSLFSSGGIGDLAVSAAGFEIIVSNELLEDRHALFEYNFPRASLYSGDLRELKTQIAEHALARLRGHDLDLLYATPPCQGMSKNGRGKLLSAIRQGNRPAMDVRNRLILPTLDVAVTLRPRILLLENVPEMLNTVVSDERGRVWDMIELITDRLGEDYLGKGQVVEFADFGVPQRRQRAITIFTRDPTLKRRLKSTSSLIPPASHGPTGSERLPWITLRDAIGDLPPLDAGSPETAGDQTGFHRVPTLDAMKYWWVRHTPEGAGAFDNQCVSCGFNDNPTHRAGRDKNGVNRTSRETPVYCLKCGALLPRPSMPQPDGKRRLMRGFTSAYRRMRYDQPASTLTRNLSYACSDRKLHPTQHRVLSLEEAMRVHTLDQFDYRWQRADGRRVSDKTIREIIGESIPPAGLAVITRHLAKLLEGMDDPTPAYQHDYGPLFELATPE